ncbi:MAG: tetratricopeptide repeat protein, partial [Woeseiaceae bacterium]|nr:tetratricopeptide repeat protein [Woeseiaceae bacterium]
TTLTNELPDKFYYVAWLATLLDQWGHTGAAVDRYLAYLKRQPENANAHFNLALLYKRQKRFDDALNEYTTAIDLGIKDPEEAYSNMGLVYSEMRDAEAAEKMFKRSLETSSNYIPALFNYAGLCEETGRKADAVELYKKIIEIDPAHHESKMRLAYSEKVVDTNDPIIGELKAALDQPQKDPIVHEGLYFALGKVLDDCGEYAAALESYDAANALGRKRNPPYDRDATSQIFAKLANLFDGDWISRVETDSTLTPVFICGMFRSGSTLVEQLLAGHPEIAAGGELDVLPWLISDRLSPYPDRAEHTNKAELSKFAEDYDAKVREIVAADGIVTDKRPDNFLHLGLIRALFPKAKIIYTQRSPLDNCLSVYFQQLGEYLPYASDIETTAHYYLEHAKLMRHWQATFGASIHTVNYDDLVRTPEPVLRDVLNFLQLPWDEACLQFENVETMVKTASVWQVREPLHESSVGRWQNYATLIERIRPMFPDQSDSS